VFHCHSITSLLWWSNSSWNGKLRQYLKAVFARPDVFQVATGLNQLLVTAFVNLHEYDITLTTGSYKQAVGAFSGK
jgi:hypothetical protein